MLELDPSVDTYELLLLCIATAAADHEMRVKKEVDRYISELGFQLLSPFFVIRLLATRVLVVRVHARGKKHNAGNDSANE